MDDSINGSDYGVLNWDSPMRFPPNAEPSSPDVSLASPHAPGRPCQRLAPIIYQSLIRLQIKTTTNPGLRRTYVNLKKANWDRYRQEV